MQKLPEWVKTSEDYKRWQKGEGPKITDAEFDRAFDKALGRDQNRKRLGIVIGFIVLVACIGLYFTPHLTIHNMKKAAAAKDADAFSSYIDFPSVRESFKANMSAQMTRDMAKSKSNNPFEAIGTALAVALINPMIDSLVTPEYLAMMMKGENPQMSPPGIETRKPQPKTKESDTETSISYKGLNRFTMKVKKKDSADEPVEFIFRRDGIISWKLSGLRIN